MSCFPNDRSGFESICLQQQNTESAESGNAEAKTSQICSEKAEKFLPCNHYLKAHKIEMWLKFVACSLILQHFRSSAHFCTNQHGFCVEDGVQIFWELDGLHQNDHGLIEALKNKVLLQPPKGKKSANQAQIHTKIISGF